MDKDILFIGAHADDIEIGAGGTVAKLAERGEKVWYCILTDDTNENLIPIRRAEAINAGESLGVKKERILFGAFSDGKLRADRDTVASLRHLLSRSNCDPQLIFTHSSADSHNDHRAAAELTLSTFRKKIVLHFSIVNSSIYSNFYPRIFVDISQYKMQKNKSLSEYKSQADHGRIFWKQIGEIETNLGAKIGASNAEGFELTTQQGADDLDFLMTDLNDCGFHAFWHLILDERKLMNIHGTSVYRREKEYHWQSDKDRSGMALLRRAFNERWIGPAPLDEHNCKDERVDELFYGHDVLLSGGAVSNTITRNYFNHFPGIRYVIDFDMPDYRNIRILDKEKGLKICALYEKDEVGGLVPVLDRCIVTVMRNPLHPRRHLIGIMGIHGFGTYCGYLLISNSYSLRQFMASCEMPIPGNLAGYQVISTYDVRMQKSSWDWSTLHKIPSIATNR